MFASIDTAAEKTSPTARMRARYQEGPAYISVDRARYYTESWRETEDAGLPLPVRIAEAMHHVYAHMRHHVEPEEQIAGYWTEHFLGVPLDIERGVFNDVLAAELKKSTLVRFRMRSAAKAVGYLLRKGTFAQFVRNQRRVRAGGAPPLNMELKTMATRAINAWQIAPADRKLLLRDLLPYWRGRCVVSHLHKALLASGLYSRDMHDFITGLPGNTSRQVMLINSAASIATLQGHVILDYGPVLREGLEALHAQATALAEHAPAQQRPFLQANARALEGVQLFATRLTQAVARAADQAQNSGTARNLHELAAVCARVPAQPARTFREAVQALWTVKTAVELAHPVNLHCFGRLDQMLYPYYRADLDAGRTTPGQARRLLDELLLKIMSQNVRPESNILANFYHRFLGSSPVTLGGVDAEGNDATNELTYLFLDAAHSSKAITNVSVRVHPDTPDALLERVAAYLAEGTSSFSLFNDDTHVEAMRRRGFTPADARDYAVMGCVETTCPGKTGAMSANALLLAKLLDMTLRDGATMTIAGPLRHEGARTGKPEEFADFEDLIAAFFAQGKDAIAKVVTASNLRDRIYAEHQPAPFISAFMEGCLESRCDVTAGGARYDLSGISLINSIANVTDALLVIKRLVYEEKRYTFADLLAALDANFEDHEELHAAMRDVPDRWGNGQPEADALARRIMQGLLDEIAHYTNYRGGPFVPYVISMITHTFEGRISMATPDGRRAATPFAASCNPANVERNGVTGALLSVAALPNAGLMGAAVNVKFHPSALGATPQARAKWVALVRTYMRLGGAQLQPTVVSGAMLRAAREHPDQYRDLIVKVGGYSTYFVDLGHEIQDEIIARTEHG
ncbi:MAG: pyruvate formate lyase family protein [Candidatus Hydrogenedentota bacterium]